MVAYTSEAAVKILSRGFVVSEFSYLRSCWRLLELAVVVLAHVSFFLPAVRFSAVRFARALGLPPLRDRLMGKVGAIFMNLRDLVVATGLLVAACALAGLHVRASYHIHTHIH